MERRTPAHRRGSTAAAAATLILGLGAGPAFGDDAALERFRHQSLTWHACGGGGPDDLGDQLDRAGARCTEVVVPLSYAVPAGPTIEIAISRRKAAQASRRLGTLVTNSGGPGESRDTGLLWLTTGIPGSPVPGGGLPKVAAAYDLVSFDPRMQGRSAPLECGWPTAVARRAQFVGPDRRSFEASVTANRELAARCEPHRALLPHASTRNVARDLDLIRDALGEQTISYVGTSYGSILGATYMQMFPGRVGRVVLDSSLDPETWGPDASRRDARALDAEQRHWATWVARRDRRFHLGATTAAVLGELDTIRRAADAGRRLRIGHHRVDPNLIRALRLGNDAEPLYAAWAGLIALLADAARGVHVDAPPAMEPLFAELTSQEVSLGDSALQATVCADRPPRSYDPEAYFQDIVAHRRDEALFGPSNRTVTPCSFWPAAPAEAPTVIGNDVPALLVGARGDSTAPYAGQLSMHRALGRSVMLTLDGAFTHGVVSFEPNVCVAGTVDRYLLHGRLPAHDVRCRRASPVRVRGLG